MSKKDETMTVAIELSVLMKFIKPYDGNRETLNPFINNCDNAITLASLSQQEIIFKYIQSQLLGKAEIACSVKDFDNWFQLKEFLRSQFGERKHYSYLLTELQECKQGHTESISQFILRIETLQSKLLTEATMSCAKKAELAGRIAMIEDLALHSFLIGVNPRISNIIRCKSPKNLNEALNIAMSEEKIQESIRRNHSTIPKLGKNDYQTNSEAIHKPKFYMTQQQHPQTATCRYCHFPGHTIQNCRKRQFNNNRLNTNSSSNKYQPTPNPRNQINHLIDNDDQNNLN